MWHFFDDHGGCPAAELISEDFLVFFNLADIALVEIDLDVSGQSAFAIFFDIFAKLHILLGLGQLFVLA